MHEHGRQYHEETGSQPFASACVLGIEEYTLSDGNRSDKPGEHQGKGAEAEDQPAGEKFELEDITLGQ